MGRLPLLPVPFPLVLGAKLLLIVTCEGTVTGFALTNPKLFGEREQARQMHKDHPPGGPGAVAPRQAPLAARGQIPRIGLGTLAVLRRHDALALTTAARRGRGLSDRGREARPADRGVRSRRHEASPLLRPAARGRAEHALMCPAFPMTEGELSRSYRRLSARYGLASRLPSATMATSPGLP
jgi:hypothetical protein